jgi:hypothetical protein
MLLFSLSFLGLFLKGVKEITFILIIFGVGISMAAQIGTVEA